MTALLCQVGDELKSCSDDCTSVSGQQVVEEILDAQRPGCPPEYFNIPVPEGHPYSTEHPRLDVLPLLRTRYDANTGYSPGNPRQQLNEITPYLDGGLVYGVAKGWADVLRTFSNGTLAPHGLLAWHDELGEGFPAGNSQRLPMANPPAPTNHSEYLRQQSTAVVNRFFKLGNPRGNENPFLLTFGIVLFRWHNAIARRLHDLHPSWTHERLFNEARKWVIATHQSVVMYDWLPKWIREDMPPYTGYRPTVDPQVSHVFQSAAMRFGHTLVTSGVYLRSKASEGCVTVPYDLSFSRRPEDGGPSHSAGVRTCNSFWRSPELFMKDPSNFEKFLLGMSSQSSEKEDNIIVEDLRGRVFGPLEFSRRDLMAINIQRGRDHGLPDYNTARRHFGLEPLTSLEPSEYKRVTHSDVNDEVLQRLQDVYGSPDVTDIWPGGILETRKYGPGQLFTSVTIAFFFLTLNQARRVFGPLEFSRRDLMAINIQRGRDHGLPDYNTARRHFGLEPLTSLEPSEYKRVTHSDVNDEVLQRLQDVYGSPDVTDIWPGGILETRKYGPGQLFTRIIMDQFQRIRDGDRFWFENTNNGQFTDVERQKIKQVKLLDILLTVADISLDDIQLDPLTAVNDENALVNCTLQLSAHTPCVVFRPATSRQSQTPTTTPAPPRSWNGPPPVANNVSSRTFETMCFYLPPLGASNLEPCSLPRTFDYFTGSAVPFILTFFVVTLLAVGLLLLVIMMSRRKQSERARSVTSTIKVTENGIAAKERVSGIESRFVVVEFISSERRINVRHPSGSLLRTVDLQHLNELRVRHIASCKDVILRAQHHYDLYLKFSDDIQGHKLLSVLKKFCEDTGIEPEYHEESRFTLRRGVTTNKDRAQELAKFSRLVLSKSVEEIDDQSAASVPELASSSNSNLFSMEITRAELAEQLGTTPDTLFMQQLFRLMDKDKNGFILLKEFWDVMVLFAKGSLRDKAQFIFNIYDVSQTGLLRDSDLTAVVESMLGSESKNTNIDVIVNNIMESVNLRRGEAITFEKFFELFSGKEGVLRSINLQAGSRSLNRSNRQRFSIYGLMRDSDKSGERQQREQKQPFDDPRADKINVAASSQETGDLKRYIYSHQVYVWWLIIYTSVMFLIVAERAYYYSCPNTPTHLTPLDLWLNPVSTAAFLSSIPSFSAYFPPPIRPPPEPPPHP
ncbi:hypothetical protein FHG87_010072 [Trinorchestia longiramus]|nr:hypothetical protein FHG87_010072 [Trinorchestia longiramus]